jgi:hypothetical protein
MKNIELNKKLTQWVFPKVKFHYGEWDTEKVCPEINIAGKPYRTHAIDYKLMPNFIQSLDACFELLMPKLEGLELKYVALKKAGNLSGAYCSARLFQGSRQYDSGITETPALALCKAVEKLINSEVSHD